MNTRSDSAIFLQAIWVTRYLKFPIAPPCYSRRSLFSLAMERWAQKPLRNECFKRRYTVTVLYVTSFSGVMWWHGRLYEVPTPPSILRAVPLCRSDDGNRVAEPTDSDIFER